MKPRVLCIFNRLLGNKQYSFKLEECLSSNLSINPTFLYFDWEDYSAVSNIPKIFQTSAVIESAAIIKKKYQEQLSEIPNNFDILFFVSYWLPIGFYKEIKTMPTVIALDSNPTLSHSLLRKTVTSRAEKFRSFISLSVTSYIYKKIFKNVDFFIPYSQWCSESLVNDYGVKQEKNFVSYYPVDLHKWKPQKSAVERNGEKVRILFVGNDFVRKGGEFLLELYTKYLSQFCTFLIVSNDPYFQEKTLPSGVELVSGLTHNNLNELISIYQTSSLFVLPTKRDQLPQVIIEAMATGLPVITTDVGGIHDLVKDNYNGFLLSEDSDYSEWYEKIQFLINNPAQYEMFSRRSRLMIEDKCSVENFNTLTNKVVDLLIAKV